MAKRRTPLIAFAVCLLVIAYGVADSIRPFVTTKHDVVVSTPALGALEQRFTVTMRPGDETCIRPVVLTPDSEVARFRVVVTQGPPVPPIEVTASGPGYRSSATLSGYPAPQDQLPLARLDPPDRELVGQVCARNAGRRRVELVGTDEIRSQVPANLVVNGEDVPGKEIELTMLKAERASWLSRPGDLVDHAAALTGDFTPEWLLWIVLVLVVLGIPAGAAAGFYRVLRDDDR